MPNMYDVIVVGGGVMGSAAAYVLSKQGKTTLLLEQFPLPHTRGSSAGASRIIRRAYPEQFNANLVNLAMPMWAELEKESGMKLFRQTGMLVSSVSQIEDLKDTRTILENCYGTDVPLLGSDILNEKYQPMRFTSDEYGCIDPGAGVLYASKCLHAFQRVFERNGGTIADNHRVVNITPGETVTVHTDKGDFQSKGVVLTCGPWASRLLGSVGVRLPLEAEAIQVCYWKSKPGIDYNNMPCYINYLPGNHIYALPPDEYADMVKICLHNGRSCDPDMREHVDAELESKDMIKLKEIVCQVFPGVISEPAVKERCIYTCTPDHTCVVDQHPTYKNIVYAVGFSGSGFKLAPAIGVILSDLVLHQKAHSLLVDEMRASRFKKTSKL